MKKKPNPDMMIPFDTIKPGDVLHIDRNFAEVWLCRQVDGCEKVLSIGNAQGVYKLDGLDFCGYHHLASFIAGTCHLEAHQRRIPEGSRVVTYELTEKPAA